MSTLHAVSRAQHGLITTAQARDHGLHRRQIARQLDRGDWVPIHRGVYQLGGIELGRQGRLLAAVLATGGIASHRAATELWNLGVYQSPHPEITVPTGSSARLAGVEVHHSKQWERRDETMRGSIPCTGIDRTLLDCGAVMSVYTVEKLAESAIRQRLTTWEELKRCLLQHSIQGRDGCGNMRRLLNYRLSNPVVPLSEFSRLVTNLLTDGGLPAPVLEYRIRDDAGRFVMQADLAWPARKKAWELDGLAFHFGRTDVERDRRKRNRAKSCGWNIQEILWSMYADERASLVPMAREFLEI